MDGMGCEARRQMVQGQDWLWAVFEGTGLALLICDES